MLPDQPIALSADSRGCALETRPRSIQEGSTTFTTSLNQDWLSQLGVCAQGAQTLHSFATRPVIIRYPAIIIQPADLIGSESGDRRGAGGSHATRRRVRDVLEGEIGLAAEGAREAAETLGDRGLLAPRQDATTDGGKR